ncbi:MAG: alpha/beta fold hydrolase [Anaerolineae bacterium]|nr:alpha/beta fold hydrolase [Anaerolineae bacterium]
MRKLALLFITAVVLLPLFPVDPVAGQARAGRTVALNPCKFTVGIGDSKYDVDAKCGTLAVPEDRSKPDGRKLDIHFTILAATNPNAKGLPIFHFEGGPGGAAISSFGETWFSAYRLLREDHDIVLIDQRGTGTSASLQCTEITDKAFDDLAQPLTDDESHKLSVERMNACLNRVSSTADPAFFTSTILADDTDAVRAALGYDQIDVFGNSYGTWLGQIYLGRYGKHVHAMVLDSTVGPWNWALLDSANNAEASLNRIFALCESDAQCVKVYPDLSGKLQTALDKLDAKPVKLSAAGPISGKSYDVVITRSRLLESFRLMFYNSSYISTIPQAVAQAAQGIFTLPATMLVAYAELGNDMSLGLYYSVHCSESAAFYTDSIVKQYQRGSYYNSDDKSVDQLKETCQNWRSTELDAADVAPVKSDRPVLILSGVFDPITPVSYGEETHQRLPNSTLAVFPYQAHGPMASNKCAQRMVAAFFNDPAKPVDTSCTKQDVKPVFMGAYQVKLVPFTDPNNTFSAQVPQDWTVQTDKSDGPMTFLTDQQETQLLGIGIFKNMKAADAQKAALDNIRKAYGPVDVQFSQSMLFITIVQVSLDAPNEVYTGALIIQQIGSNTKIVFHAAPSNIFQAVLVPVAPPVFASVNPR